MIDLLRQMVFGSEFTFETPYSLEQSAQLLLERSERDGRPSKQLGLPIGSPRAKLLVNVDNVDEDTHKFNIQRDASRNLIIEVNGTLTRQGRGTMVQGRARISPFVLGFLALWLPVWVVIWTAIGVLEPILPGVVVVVVLLSIAGMARERLARIPQETLGQPAASPIRG